MQCHEFELVLEQRAAELPAEAATHVNACKPCRALVSDLKAIDAVARELGAEPAEPPERVWLSLRAQLQSEGLIRRPRKTGWLSEWLAMLPRPALAGAYLSFVLVAAVIVGFYSRLWLNQPGPPVAVPPATASLGTQLSAVQQHAVSALRHRNPVVTASLHQNLQIVDNAISICEKTMREEPQNEIAREYLYGAYQQKAELLASMTERGEIGDE